MNHFLICHMGLCGLTRVPPFLMKPQVLLTFLASFLVVRAAAAARQPTLLVATKNQSDIESALLNAKAAMDELNKVLKENELVIVENDLEANAQVPLEFTDVMKVLANPEAVDDALRQQELARLDRRYAMRLEGINPDDKDARRQVSMSASAFFQIQTPALDQISKAANKIFTEKEMAAAKASKDLDSQLDLLDSQVSQSLYSTVQISSFYIATARLRDELRLANLPYMIRYNEQVKLAESRQRVYDLAVAAAKVCSLGVTLTTLPLNGLGSAVILFKNVQAALSLLDEVIDNAVSVAEDGVLDNAVKILDQTVQKYAGEANSMYQDAMKEFHPEQKNLA